MRVAACILVSMVPALPADLLSVKSPGGRVEFRLLTLEGGRLGYGAALKGKAVIDPSPLGIVVDGVNLAANASVGKARRYKTNGTYAWRGVHSVAVDRSNGVRIPVKHGSTPYTLEVRAYDDGIAFRFIVPGTPGQSRVPDEATSFRLPAGSTVWYHDFEGHYEAVHVKKSIEQVPPGQWAAPPVTFKLPANGGYASITEGALFRYSGMGLQADGKGGFDARLGHAHPPSYPFRLRYAQDVARMAKPAAVEGAITTPWRVVIMGADLNALVNCDIVHNVAPPPDPKLFPKGAMTDWIKPGRAVWRYLDGGEGTIEGQKEFSRLAHDLGFEYNVLEGFWRKWSEQELKDYIAYSRAQGVGVLLWKHSKELRDPASRREFFDLCQRTGAAGAKIDFFDHEHKDVVELYEACLRDAAERHLVLDFHGANKPTGESRTYPNELTREAIRGMESRKAVRAPHDATLPFTRMLAGHADYTPVHFGERRNDTTWAHQIASAAILTSPLLVYAANPANIIKNPAAAIIKSIPSVWDATIALPASQIGEVAVFARRSGKTWFLAIMNGTTARRVPVPLSFLGPGSYRAAMVRDNMDDAAAVRIEKGAARRSDTLRIELRAGGGFLARFEP